MYCNYSCKTVDHIIARRRFLGGLAAGMGLAVGGGLSGLGLFTEPAGAAALAKNHKRMLVVFMAGGLSQLESWDPKPNTNTGGPFRAIPTSVPGLHISELLPMTAKQMHRLCVVRGVNTSEDDHGKGSFMMTTGRRQMGAAEYPHLGAVVSKAITPAQSPIPGHLQIVPGGGGGRGADAAYLGPQYAGIYLGNGNAPANSVRPGDITPDADASRQAFRKRADDLFANRRRTAMTEAYTATYDQAQRLMERKEVFDVSKEPEKDHERYGKYDFGRHCLLARRLLENESTYVQVMHSNYDTHNENFDFHLEQMGEFDRSFAALIDDLAQRGLLSTTLVVVMSEFGRTPHINQYYGRDHWSKAWSVVVGGGKITPGAVYGKTNAEGTAVTDGQVDHAHLFHTYLAALGLDSYENFNVNGQTIPMADPASRPIKEILT